MEDIRTYRFDKEDDRRLPEDERAEWSSASQDDEVPFHVPRD